MTRDRAGRLAALAAATLACGVVFAWTDDSRADDAVPRWAYAMAGELMSPFCPGLTVSECPSPQAESLRMWILEQARQGRTRADIEEQLYLQYGDQILATPRLEGMGLAAYAIPVVVFLAGGALVGWLLGRWTRQP